MRCALLPLGVFSPSRSAPTDAPSVRVRVRWLAPPPSRMYCAVVIDATCSLSHASCHPGASKPRKALFPKRKHRNFSPTTLCVLTSLSFTSPVTVVRSKTPLPSVAIIYTWGIFNKRHPTPPHPTLYIIHLPSHEPMSFGRGCCSKRNIAHLPHTAPTILISNRVT